jgi:ATP-dependent Lon protease
VARRKRVSATVTPKNLVTYLGQAKVFRETRGDRDRIGVVTGLAWTSFGGEILFVEATRMSGRGNLILTGQLGSVMRESAQAALSYVRGHAKEFGGDPSLFGTSDFHIHVPAGAMPKDGPSAGVAMVTALASLVSGRKVRADTAMTGEISLRGMVLPIGGLKQKILGARRARMRRVILPAHNEPDLIEIPDKLRDGMEFVLVESIRDVFEGALLPAEVKAKPAKPKSTVKVVRGTQEGSREGARVKQKQAAEGRG